MKAIRVKQLFITLFLFANVLYASDIKRTLTGTVTEFQTNKSIFINKHITRGLYVQSYNSGPIISSTFHVRAIGLIY